MRLMPEEVQFLNETVQVYSRNFVYFRRDRPTLIDEFSRRMFLEYPLHRHPWLDRLLEVIANNLFLE